MTTPGWGPDADASAASSPTTPGADLARIANDRPDLRPAIAANPATYPELLAWLAQWHDGAIDAALAARASAAAPVAPPAAYAQPQQPYTQPQQPYAQPQQPYAQPSAGFDPTVSYGQPGYGYQVAATPVPAAPRRKVWPWVAGGVALVVLVGGGLTAWLMLGRTGASSPEAATTGFVEALGGKNLLGMARLLSPAEVQPMQRAADTARAGAPASPAADVDYKAVLDALTIEVEGLETETDEVDDGLAKVSLTDGTLTIDGDPEVIADAVMDAYEAYGADSAFGEQFSGEDMDDARDELVDGLRDSLPYTVDLADDLEVDGDPPFVMAVEEGGRWYVSPMMTLGEYITVAAGLDRGDMLDADEVERPATPVEAAELYTQALVDLYDFDARPLAAVLPTAERRFVAVYVDGWLDSAGDAVGDLDFTVDVPSAEFEVLDTGAGTAHVVATDVVVSVDAPSADESGTLSFDGDCLSVDAEGMDDIELCLSDLPLAETLGLDQLPLTVVKEGGAWYVTPIGTFADLAGTAGARLAELQEQGVLDDEDWWAEQVPEDFLDQFGYGDVCAFGDSGCSEDWSDDDWSDEFGDDWSDEFGDDWSDEFGDEFSDDYGDDWSSSSWTDETWADDPEAAELHEACSAGDWVSCDDLFFGSEMGSDLEEFASTCGGAATDETYGSCEWTMESTEP